MNRPAGYVRLLLIVCLASIAACKHETLYMPRVEKPDPDSPDKGIVKDGIYYNYFFNFSLPIPENWAVAGTATEEYIMEAGKAIVASDPQMEAAVEFSAQNVYQLLTISEFEIGAAVESNSSFVLYAERVSHAPGIKTGKDYLMHVTRMLLEGNLPYERTKEGSLTKLSDKEFYREDVQLRAVGREIQQAYYATILGDFALVVVLSAQTEEQMTRLEEVASTLRFVDL